MTLQPSRIKTQAETRLTAQFAALGEVSAERRAAFARFEVEGLPNRRIEAYHFTDLRAAIVDALPLAAPVEPSPPRPAAWGRETTIVIRDGRYDPGLSDAMPQGVRLTVAPPRATAVADPVIDLNSAFCDEELSLVVAPGVAVAEPIRLAALSSLAQGRAVFRRARVVLGEGASLTLIESADGASAPNQANVLLSLELKDGAKLTHVSRVAAGAGVVMASLEAHVGADCEFSSFAFLSGGALIRRQLFVTLAGERSTLSLDGVALLRGQEHIDTTLVVTHKAPHCASRETFRHIVDDGATGVFQGKIIVSPGAQKTDGKMMSKAILLADSAVMNNKPELEIFADDVVCGHGATVGALDDDQVFYLMARGIPRAEAEALLLEAFAGAVIDTISHEKTRERMGEHLRHWLADRKR